MLHIILFILKIIGFLILGILALVLILTAVILLRWSRGKGQTAT